MQIYKFLINVQGTPRKQPLEKFDISGIVADIFTKFTVFTDKDSVHISCNGTNFYM